MVVFLAAFLLLAAPAFAVEQRCTDLGAACTCSEPLNTNSFTNQIGWYWNPADSTTKECSQEVTNHPISRNTAVYGTNNSTVLAAMPNRQGINYVLWGGNNNTGIWFIGNDLATPACASPYVRCESRWYRYVSSDYQPTDGGGGGSCTGDKRAHVSFASGGVLILEPAVNALASQGGGDGYNAYNFDSPAGWTPSGRDCCGHGPRVLTTDHYMTLAEQKGKWWRWSHVVRNPAGGTGTARLRIEVYARNITDNGPEYKVLDLEGTGTGGDGWYGPYTTVTPPSRIKTVYANNYRESTCAGFAAYSHFIEAHWTTDAGQRIPGAVEVEGGGAPTPPTGTIILSVRSFLPVFFAIGLGSLAMVCMVMGLLATLERRRQYATRTQGPLDGPADLWGQLVGPRPVDWPTSPAQHAPERVVLDASADELVGVASEVEGTARQGARIREKVLR